MYRKSLALLTVLLLAACGVEETAQPATPGADTIYVNGRVYTVDSSQPWADAFAVRDGELVAVGSQADMQALAGPATRTIDLSGQFVMPGIQDMHMHPVDGGLSGVYECAFSDTMTAQEIIDIVAGCVAQAEPGEWIQGGQWGPLLTMQTPSGLLDMLDAVSPDNPVYLIDWALHAAWVNSAALAAFNINGTTPDPTGGVIGREDSGTLSGILYDNAAYNARQKIPAYTAEQIAEALRYSQNRLLGHGITSYKDALVTPRNLQGYLHLIEQGGLKARVKASLAWKSAWSAAHESERLNIQQAESRQHPRFDPRYAKIMLDGIPPTYTAALLEPYAPSQAFGDEHYGKLMHTPEVLNADVIDLDALGMTVKIHATGDRSVRLALDAIEAARQANPGSTLRHEVSHAEMIHADDLPRFAELGVAAEMCPILWYPSPAIDAMRMAMGERANRFWPVRSLVESGALVFYGSDWPSVVPDTNPWPGIEAMVTRRDPYDRFPGVYWPEEAVDLATALKIFTLNGAVAGRQETTTGSLTPGKRADFIVLDRNPFDIPANALGDVRVLQTFIDGVQVWTEPDSQ